MKDESKVEDSLEFCKEIKFYEQKDDPLTFDESNYPKLKEYINWIDETEETVEKDYQEYEQCLKQAEYVPEKEADTEVDLDEEPEKRSILKEILQIASCILIAFVLVFVITTYIATYTRVNGESMEDTLYNGDVLIINRLSYYFHEPEQFDVIVFENNPGVNLVKRVIGLPGQTIQIIDGTIYIDGEVVNENYGTTEISSAGNAEDPITLGEDEYFVLGDNRNKSTDSRSSYVGVVKRDQIIGKVGLRLYPFDRIGTVE